MVIVELTRWPTSTRGAIGHVTEVLGDIDAPGVDTEIIIRKYGIPDAHSAEAVAEASGSAPRCRSGTSAARTDFRQVPTVTIDGEHARDFDDAITIEKLANGNYWLGVHIADVSHYVQEGARSTARPTSAARRCTFPSAPCTCSRRSSRPAVQPQPARRSAGAVVLHGVDRRGAGRALRVPRRRDQQRRADDLHRGQRHPDRPRSELLERYAPLVPMFELMRELFQILNDARRRRGRSTSICNEAEVIIDDGGVVEAIIALAAQRRAPADRRVHAAGNETVASYLESQERRRSTASTRSRTSSRSPSSRSSSRASATASARR
jgi:ribonuclease R